MLDLSIIFAALVLTLLLTAIIYIFLDNTNIKWPNISNELFNEKKTERNLIKSLVISLVIVIIFLLIKFKGKL